MIAPQTAVAGDDGVEGAEGGERLPGVERVWQREQVRRGGGVRQLLVIRWLQL